MAILDVRVYIFISSSYALCMMAWWLTGTKYYRDGNNSSIKKVASVVICSIAILQ